MAGFSRLEVEAELLPERPDYRAPVSPRSLRQRSNDAGREPIVGAETQILARFLAGLAARMARTPAPRCAPACCAHPQ